MKVIPDTWKKFCHTLLKIAFPQKNNIFNIVIKLVIFKYFFFWFNVAIKYWEKVFIFIKIPLNSFCFIKIFPLIQFAALNASRSGDTVSTGKREDFSVYTRTQNRRKESSVLWWSVHLESSVGQRGRRGL